MGNVKHPLSLPWSSSEGGGALVYSLEIITQPVRANDTLNVMYSLVLWASLGQHNSLVSLFLWWQGETSTNVC